MADQKISELNAKTTVHDTDLFPMVDVEAETDETKKITGANLKAEVLAGHKDLTTGVHSFDKSCLAYHSAAQNISHNTWTYPAFDSESWDTDTIHDLVTNNSRLTCKTAGNYIITLRITFQANDTGQRIALIAKNRSASVSEHRFNAAGGSLETIMSLAGIMDLAVNDYVEAQVYQNSGSTLTINGLLFAMARLS